MKQGRLDLPAWPFNSVTFRVFGIPRPKGSMVARIRRVKGRPVGRPWVVAADDGALHLWSKSVSGSALAAVHRHPVRPVYQGRPLAADVTFVLERTTKTSQVARWAHYAAAGDLDKLLRATLDPMEGIVFDNDKRFVEIACRKRYHDEGAGVPVGAIVQVWPLDRDEED